MTYSEKLRDPRWQKKRLKVMERDKFTCQMCGSTKKTLNIHHLRYHGEPWNTPLKYLKTICEDCHSGLHKNQEKQRKCSNTKEAPLSSAEGKKLFRQMRDSIMKYKLNNE